MERGECGPGRLPGRLPLARRHRGHGRERHVLQLRRYAELAVALVDVRKVPQIALHPVLHLLHLAGLHCAPHPLPGAGADAQRQVARHLHSTAFDELAVQRQHARQARALAKAGARPGVPGGMELAAGVGVVEVRIQHFQFDAGQAIAARWRGVHPPLQLRAQVLERHAGFFKHAGQFEHAVMQLQLGLAAGLASHDVQVGATPAGPADAARLGRGGRGNGQALDLGLGLPGARRIQGPFPAGLQGAHGAVGVELAQQVPQAVADGQTFTQVGQQGQVEPVGAELAAGVEQGGQAGPHRGGAGCRRRGRGRRVFPQQGHLAGRPGCAIGRGEGQALNGQAQAAVLPLGREPPFQRGQRHGREVGAQLHRHIAQRCVQRQGLGQALVPIYPGAQGGLALLKGHWQVKVLAQLRHVRTRQVGVQRALPALPVAGAGQQRAAGLAHDGKAIAPIGGRRGVQPQLVPAAPVAHHQLHIAQLQWRRGALFVDPAQRAAPDQQLVLFKEPVGCGRAVHRAGAFGVHVEAAHEPASRCIAPHFQPGAVDQQLLKAQPQCQQGGHRHRGRYLRQPQGLAPAGVTQHHIAQGEGRYPARAVHADLADLHRMPQGLRGLCLDARTPLVQSGQNQPMQCKPGRKAQRPAQQKQPQRDAPGPAPGPSPMRLPTWPGKAAHRGRQQIGRHG